MWRHDRNRPVYRIVLNWKIDYLFVQGPVWSVELINFLQVNETAQVNQRACRNTLTAGSYLLILKSQPTVIWLTIYFQDRHNNGSIKLDEQTPQIVKGSGCFKGVCINSDVVCYLDGLGMASIRSFIFYGDVTKWARSPSRVDFIVPHHVVRLIYYWYFCFPSTRSSLPEDVLLWFSMACERSMTLCEEPN